MINGRTFQANFPLWSCWQNKQWPLTSKHKTSLRQCLRNLAVCMGAYAWGLICFVEFPLYLFFCIQEKRYSCARVYTVYIYTYTLILLLMYIENNDVYAIHTRLIMIVHTFISWAHITCFLWRVHQGINQKIMEIPASFCHRFWRLLHHFNVNPSLIFIG